ncbi:MAG: hypothetical protein MOB07_23165 [Acidobacteria bacterium]|nr:hypothetical protein [Acidobacteriota bacterium]
MNDTQNYQNGSQDTSKIASSIPSEPNEQDSLPRGSGLSLKTIEMLARQIVQADSLPDAQELAKQIQQSAQELIKRVEKRAAQLAA